MNSDKGGDILTEMRFFVPNIELEMMQEEEEKKKPPKKKAGNGSGDEEDDEEEEEEGEQMTAAKLLNEKIIKAAGIGEFAGEMIASFP